MKLLKLFKFGKKEDKINAKDKKLLEDYDKGIFLRVDEDIDNKTNILKLRGLENGSR